MTDDSIIGRRVKLSPEGERARVITRGSKTGTIKGVRMNGEPTRLLVKRDGVKHVDWYDASFWTIEESKE